MRGDLNVHGKAGFGANAGGSRLLLHEPTGNAGGHVSGTLALEHGNSGGASSIVFRSTVNGTSDYGFLRYQDTSTLGGTGESARLVIGTSDNADDHLILSPSGNVGIGTNNPVADLHVYAPDNDTARIYAMGDSQGGGMVYVGQSNSYGGGIAYDGDGSPNIVGPVDNVTLFRRQNGADHGVMWWSEANNTVRLANNAIVISDARVKEVVGLSDGAQDLATLASIEVTDYVYRDQEIYGDKPQKRVIAQQVESVFPQAVDQTVGVVPDIEITAPIEQGWISMANELAVGERVRLVASDANGVYEVLERRADAFRTAFTTEANEVFVYGREVDDFHAVDYDAIAMLNVSATQELHRQLAAKTEHINALEARLAAIETMLAKGQLVTATSAE